MLFGGLKKLKKVIQKVVPFVKKVIHKVWDVPIKLTDTVREIIPKIPVINKFAPIVDAIPDFNRFGQRMWDRMGDGVEHLIQKSGGVSKGAGGVRFPKGPGGILPRRYH